MTLKVSGVGLTRTGYGVFVTLNVCSWSAKIIRGHNRKRWKFNIQETWELDIIFTVNMWYNLFTYLLTFTLSTWDAIFMKYGDFTENFIEHFVKFIYGSETEQW